MQLLGYAEAPIDEQLRQRIHALFNPEQSRIDEVCEVNVLLGEAFAAAAAPAIRAGRRRGRPGRLARPDRLAPGRARATPARRCSWASRRSSPSGSGVTTIADFRPRDIAAGGQGAPLASWGDALLFGDQQLSRAVQNIGGIGNVTWVPPGGQWEAMLAFDTGPGNALIDHAAWRLSGGMQRFDADGALAARVASTMRCWPSCSAIPTFRCSRPRAPAASCSARNWWIRSSTAASSAGLSTADILATLTAFTAHSIADQYRRFLPAGPTKSSSAAAARAIRC